MSFEHVTRKLLYCRLNSAEFGRSPDAYQKSATTARTVSARGKSSAVGHEDDVRGRFYERNRETVRRLAESAPGVNGAQLSIRRSVELIEPQSVSGKCAVTTRSPPIASMTCRSVLMCVSVRRSIWETFACRVLSRAAISSDLTCAC